MTCVNYHLRLRINVNSSDRSSGPWFINKYCTQIIYHSIARQLWRFTFANVCLFTVFTGFRPDSSKTSGRLNNGIPQVPVKRSKSDLDSFRKKLPVASMADDLLAAIDKFPVLLVCGETGSGKTTQVSDCRQNQKFRIKYRGYHILEVLACFSILWFTIRNCLTLQVSRSRFMTCCYICAK